MESRRSPGSRSSLTHSPSEPRCGPSNQNQGLGRRSRLRDRRPLSIDGSRPKVAHHPPPTMAAWSSAGPVRPGFELGSACGGDMGDGDNGGEDAGIASHRIAPGLLREARPGGQQKELVLSRMRRAPCCGKRRAGRRAAWWRQLIGEGQLSWHAGRCWARRRRQVPSLWFWVVDGADWPDFSVPAAKTGALGKDKSGADMQGQLSGGCGPERETPPSHSETTSTGRSKRDPARPENKRGPRMGCVSADREGKANTKYLDDGA
jgi:hypothetical protein